jgi:hypothetical protein
MIHNLGAISPATDVVNVKCTLFNLPDVLRQSTFIIHIIQLVFSPARTHLHKIAAQRMESTLSD